MDANVAAQVLAEVSSVLRKQQELMEKIENRPPAERRVEGISMPHYGGSLGESLELFLDQARLFFEAKNIDYTHEDNRKRVLAIMVSNLTGQAAAWYITKQHEIADITALAAALRSEFIPPDLQERLRDSLYQLKQRECRDLHEYVTKYRQLISRVKEMGELDKITLFTRGLVSQTRAEVVYRRCSSVHEAINVAMEYERAHPIQLHGNRGSSRSVFQRVNDNRGFGSFGRNPNRTPAREPQPEPMDIGYGRVISRDECQRRNLCFFCKEPGHRMAQCRKRSGQRGPPRQPSRQQQSYQRQRDARTPRGNDGAAAVLNHRVHSYEENEPEVETELFERLTINAAGIRSSARQDQESRAHQLLVKKGKVNDIPVKVLLDSGADHNVMRKGLTSQVVRRKKAIAERFDGSVTDAQWVNEVQADVMLEGGYRLEGMLFSEWDLPPTHDVILGKPWFSRFNPTIDWRTHEVILDFDLLDPYWLIEDAERLFIMAEEEEAAGLTQCGSGGDQGGAPDGEDDWGAGSNVLAGDKMRWASSGTTTTAVASNSPAPTPPAIERMLSNYADCFPDELPNELPVSRPVEFALKMKAEARPSSRAPFRLSKTEQDALQLFVDELLRKQWIEVSDSPWVSSIFAVPKKDPTTGKAPSRADWLRSGNASLPVRWVVDYRYVNSQTEIPKIPLPRIEDLFDRMQGCRYFSTIDLAQGYHQMRVEPSSRKFTAFRTDTETYEWCVAPMGLAGMPGVWSRLMRLLFGSFDFVVVYLDDLCIFSRTEPAHIAHVAAVCEVLRAQKLYARRSKCRFGCTSVDFLGHTVSADGLRVDERKTRAIEQWPVPASAKSLQSFLGLCGYYRRFIGRFADIVLPLSNLLKKDAAWTWTDTQQRAFLHLKAALQQAPVLALPNYSKRFVVTTDASGFCCGAVLSQAHDGVDHPVAFLSKKLSRHEVNWSTHEKELFAIKLALGKWRHYLHGVEFDVFTDNSACKWFLSHPNVSGKLARWLDFFGQYSFVLHHVKGSSNVVADALSRVDQPSDDCVEKVVAVLPADPRPKLVVHACTQNCRRPDVHLAKMMVLGELSIRDLGLLCDASSCLGGGLAQARPIGVPQAVTTIFASQLTMVNVQLDKATKQEFLQGYRRDPLYKDSIKASTPTTHELAGIGTIRKQDGLLFVALPEERVLRLCVPMDQDLRTALITEAHDGPVAAHAGIRRTQQKLALWYFWPSLATDVKAYVQSCSTCIRFKSSSLRKNGMLMPLPIPRECWEIVGMDFVTGLPVSRGFDAILVVVDLLSKRPKYVPTHTTATAAATALLFFDAVVRNHGLPQGIVSDRDPKFTSSMWTELMKIMGVKLRMTTSYRAQADGQVERQNRVLEDALRSMVSLHGTDWVEVLGTVEFAHSTLVSSSTKMSPFEIDTENRRRIVAQAQQNLVDAQDRQRAQYNKKRANTVFTAGDFVYLATKNLPLAHAATGTSIQKDKFAPKFVGPFKIIKMVNSNAAQLSLPCSMSRLHDTFNIDVLRHHVESPARFVDRPLPKVSTVDFLPGDADADMHVIEALVKKRQRNRRTEYLVKWQHLDPTENTWEREQDIHHVWHWSSLLRAFRESQRQNRRGRIFASQLLPQPPPFLTSSVPKHNKHQQYLWLNDETLQDHACAIVVEIFRVYQNGYSLPQARQQERFLRSVLDADVVGVYLIGADAFVQQCRLYEQHLALCVLEPQAWRTQRCGDHAVLVQVEAMLYLRFRHQNIGSLFPSLKSGAVDPQLVQPLVTGTTPVAATYSFVVGRSGYVTSLLVSLQLLKTLQRLLGSLESVAQLTDGARIDLASGTISIA